MSKKQNNKSTRSMGPYARILVDWDPITERLIALMESVQNGAPPDLETLQMIADAVPALLDLGTARERRERFGKALGIAAATGSGRPVKDTVRDVSRVHNTVATSIEREDQLIADGMTARKARAEAVKYAASKCHVSERNVQRWRQEHGEEVRALMEKAAELSERLNRQFNSRYKKELQELQRLMESIQRQ